MKTNVAVKQPQVMTAEGGKGRRIGPEQQLLRMVMSCFLWEDGFYSDGQTIADRITQAAHDCPVAFVLDVAKFARNIHHLRHAPLHLICAALTHPRRKPVDSTSIEMAIRSCIQRADELAELVALWWKDGKRPLPRPMKQGLALAFRTFSPYALAKYNRDAAVKLRDVMFLVHPKPEGEEQAAAWKALADGTLASPDTWEVALSAGADKKETFERLIREEKLGYLALLRNLRNMMDAGCDEGLVTGAIRARKGASRVLPFRYIAAARACPRLARAIDDALLASIGELPALPGKTLVLVDVSGSMVHPLSRKSDLNRIDAACALAAIMPGDVRVFSFSNFLVECPPRKGMAGVDAIQRSQSNSGTNLFQAVAEANAMPHDRLIVITDEQAGPGVASVAWSNLFGGRNTGLNSLPDPVAKRAYMVNVACERNGVGYGPKWTHIDGFSEGIIKYIAAIEADDL